MGDRGKGRSNGQRLPNQENGHWEIMSTGVGKVGKEQRREERERERNHAKECVQNNAG